MKKKFELTPYFPHGISPSPESFRLFDSIVHAFSKVGINTPGGALFFSDNLITIARNTSFLADEAFTNAVCKNAISATDLSIIWRTHTVVWATRNCTDLDGDFVELGCHLGYTPLVINDMVPGVFSERKLWLYDLFDNSDGYFKDVKDPHVFVRDRFQNIPCNIIKGNLPDSFLTSHPVQIAFAHIDIGHANCEKASTEAILDLLAPGGMIVFNNFGQGNGAYQDIGPALSAVLPGGILELPTGQGLYIKR